MTKSPRGRVYLRHLVSEGSMTTVVGSMAAGRQPWPWRSSWELTSIGTRRKAGGWNFKPAPGDVRPPTRSHSQSFPVSSASWGPDVKSMSLWGPFSFKPSHLGFWTLVFITHECRHPVLAVVSGCRIMEKMCPSILCICLAFLVRRHQNLVETMHKHALCYGDTPCSAPSACVPQVWRLQLTFCTSYVFMVYTLQNHT